MAELKIDAQKLVPIVLVLVAAFVMLGVWGKVTTLESRVVELQAAVTHLEVVQEQIKEVDLELARVRANVADIAAARDDILTELCVILERPPEACGVAE